MTVDELTKLSYKTNIPGYNHTSDTGWTVLVPEDSWQWQGLFGSGLQCLPEARVAALRLEVELRHKKTLPTDAQLAAAERPVDLAGGKKLATRVDAREGMVVVTTLWAWET